MENTLANLLGPFSTAELAKAIGEADPDRKTAASRQEIARWRSGARIPNSGPNVRVIAKAILALRLANDIPSGDLAAVVAEVWAAVRRDRAAKKRSKPDR